ncbi:MAG: CPBP family intramembrane metalloprotease [Mitsuaria chitosanitabida]|uniref:CPBP family intramembrane glutamic endopeptidase n=1 Tax=Roseateles chitosanitabidus TaxID=65048 RepID=UPI001B1EE28D|nr:CPBP family intramembrane glutamic endopeptidase [Roseateles chitosanitabidus]MBO9687557.1 CPBP family intramembrane metalloprotease [Roseateles chitosanitabidus]
MPPNKSPFPSLLQAALLVVALYVLEMLIGAGLYDARNALGLSLEQLSALEALLGNGIVISVALHLQGSGYRDLVHPDRKSLWPTLVMVVPPVVLLMPLIVLLDMTMMSALETLLPLSESERQTFGAMSTQTLPMALIVCVIAPVVEEMLFRGVLLRGFLARYPRGQAIGYSALFFGVAHLNLYQFCLAFLLGLLLGLIYERGRSLLPCMALHAAFNTAVFVLSDASDVAAGTADASAAGAPAIPSIAWAGALIAAGIGLVALQKTLRLWPSRL